VNGRPVGRAATRDSLAPRLARLARRLDGVAVVEGDAAIARFTTYRLGGPAAALVHARSTAALEALAEVVAAERLEVLVVGRGSNLLVADRGFPGVAVVLEEQLADVAVDGPGPVTAGGGAGLQALARAAAGAGRGGLEFFVGIPGSVGGAVAMNAGGHGRETAEVLVAATVCDLLAGGVPTRRAVSELDLAYRHSALRATDVVVGAELATTPAPVEACEAKIAEIVRWRREHQPGGSNGGSVFRNPADVSAGQLIDELGLKGHRVGGAFVSPKHANFFQAEAGATADDVRALVLDVQARVRAATGVVLEPELRMIGFDDASEPA
jgi:UDP-N-acetylmuramate dehydrogenase